MVRYYVEYRTIEEALQVEIPTVPLHLIEEFIAFAKTFRDEKESGDDNLRKIYALTDKLAAVVSPCAVCEKGCTHCCRSDVHIWPVEARYIQKNSGIALNASHAISSSQADKKKPCPFLDDIEGICTIMLSVRLNAARLSRSIIRHSVPTWMRVM